MTEDAGRKAKNISKGKRKGSVVRTGCYTCKYVLLEASLVNRQLTFLSSESDMSSVTRPSLHVYAARTPADDVMDICHPKAGSSRLVQITLRTDANAALINSSGSVPVQSFRDIITSPSGIIWYRKRVIRRTRSNIVSLPSVHFTKSLKPFRRLQKPRIKLNTPYNTMAKR